MSVKSLSAAAASVILLSLCFAGISNAADDPSDVVKTFYKQYIKADPEIPLSKYAQVDMYLVKKIDRMIKKARQEDPELGGLDYDPIIYGQDVPNSFVWYKPLVEGDGAMMRIGKIWEGEKNPTSFICVSLKKRADGWKILDTADPENWDKQDCRSFRPGEPFPKTDADL